MAPLIAVVEVRGSKLLIPTVGGAVGGVLAIVIILVLLTIITRYKTRSKNKPDTLGI